MNNGTGYPASSKRRSNKREEESSMDSGHNARSSKAEPTRVATTHLTDSEIRVAEREDGGIAQDNHPSFFLSATQSFFFATQFFIIQ